MPRSATFLASNLAVSLAEHVKLEANYTVNRVDAFIKPFKSLVLVNKVSGIALDRIDIFTHGAFSRHMLTCDRSDPVAVCPPLGAYGLDMGFDVLNLGRTGVFEYLNGAFSPRGIINLHACAIAAVTVDPKFSDPTVWSGNGIKFCQSIADYAGCRVRASPELQLFKHDEEKEVHAVGWSALGLPTAFATKVSNTNYDPGEWEGPVYIFEPGKGHRIER
jgi:hypothetical protein